MMNINSILEIIGETEVTKIEAETSSLCIGMKDANQSLSFHCVSIQFEFECGGQDVPLLQTMDFGDGMNLIEYIQSMFHGIILVHIDDPIRNVDETVLDQLNLKLMATGQANFQYLTQLLMRVIQTRLGAVSNTIELKKVTFKQV